MYKAQAWCQLNSRCSNFLELIYTFKNSWNHFILPIQREKTSSKVFSAEKGVKWCRSVTYMCSLLLVLLFWFYLKH